MATAEKPSRWVHILTTDEIAASNALTASLDPNFARGEREFYESRSLNQLRVLMAQAWNCNQDCRYQMARSYLALKGGAA